MLEVGYFQLIKVYWEPNQLVQEAQLFMRTLIHPFAPATMSFGFVWSPFAGAVMGKNLGDLRGLVCLRIFMQ